MRFDDWGLRKLAYEMRDRTEGVYHERGVYQYYRFLAPPETISEVERNLRILDQVMKYLTVKLDEDLVADERLAQGVEEETHDVYSGEEE